MMPRLGCAWFLTLVLVNVSFSVAAQQARVHRVGVVFPGGPHADTVDGFRDGLRELGLQEGKQLVLYVRDVKGDLKSVGSVASKLEQEKVDLIVALTTSVAAATKQSTKSVPIVFYAGADPVSNGLVASFANPGGRLTGVHGRVADLPAKRLELLKEMIPHASRVMTYYRPSSPAAQQSIKVAREAARQLKLELVERPVASLEELKTSLGALRPGDADAFLSVADAMVTSQTELIIERANEIKLPTMVPERGSVAKGALAGYGESYYKIGRLSAKYGYRVLLGAKPSELPVEQADRIHFVINLRTAKALGVKIPQSLLLRADEVIE